ncbi:extracellular catalytic domain type 1 short-chain-length polyhydroxyalkanoate depolymerase [Puniceibacterium sediminis]|uniref:Esterase, PHB depolymerase family n=1 Tax=Puniceibacterium sediminis TaxID=1608407 RepID=A0A238Z2D7_9RHOB|nr:PHB depolymerase family esterase [Puniceibacterium sediminis]SNR77432.1 esterase, PHB depolymerase family [Puniceibacterium sediminis]
MKRTVGAPRSTTEDARSAHVSAANDLVNRTLAQHGLASPAGFGGATMQDTLQSMMSKLQGMGGAFGQSTSGVTIEGMLPGSYTCSAGTRRYRTYVPKSADQGASGLVVMLHGCTQNPEDFAIGTGMNALAERHGFVVLYPEQSRGDNAQSCWNWFSIGDQRRDRGEPAILAGMTRQVAQENEVPTGRVFAAGLSAGGAMAVILGETYPEVFSAVGAHSGLPAGAARDVASAFAAMAGNGPDLATPVAGTQTVRTIVFHGTADATVHPMNGERIYQHALNRGAAQTLHSDASGSTGGRSYQRKTVTGTDGAAMLDYWVIDGLGHAWSGGQAAGTYTDAGGPDASAEMVRFFFETDRGAV